MEDNMENRLFLYLMKHRLAVSLMLLVVTGIFGWFASRVQFDNTI